MRVTHQITILLEMYRPFNVYSSPHLGEAESSDQTSGFCDLKLHSQPDGDRRPLCGRSCY